MSERKFNFYVVPTPIGNILDITLRAIEVLKSVDIIACEDTRTTQKLLNHYDIRTKCISYHKYNERERVSYFINELQNGKTIALVSDAGTPMICDPGNIIIEELLANNFSVTSLPGATAITTFLSQIPRNTEDFSFVGFIPKSKKQIQEISQKFLNHNFVFYDSPERILKTLNIIQQERPNAKIALGRELSKLFEEIVVNNISSVINHFNQGIKGEIVCMVYADNNITNIDMEQKIKELKQKGFKDKEISVILSTLFDFNKNDVYKKSLEI